MVDIVLHYDVIIDVIYDREVEKCCLVNGDTIKVKKDSTIGSISR
ncbi:MAG TPA: hypothetical protein VFG46_23045 [Chryseolinea sp.]|nr:hypothetical protein [Chryseolinea sp.]